MAPSATTVTAGQPAGDAYRRPSWGQTDALVSQRCTPTHTHVNRNHKHTQSLAVRVRVRVRACVCPLMPEASAAAVTGESSNVDQWEQQSDISVIKDGRTVEDLTIQPYVSDDGGRGTSVYTGCCRS